MNGCGHLLPVSRTLAKVRVILVGEVFRVFTLDRYYHGLPYNVEYEFGR